MDAIKVTLVADGRSDRCLLHPLRWAITRTLRERGSSKLLEFVFADVPATPLQTRIQLALEQYPCDLLLIHRDAEKADPTDRFDEIERAIREVDDATSKVGVVPVRMSETWFLVSEEAIRRAAGNPSGKTALALPSVRDLESNPDPKKVLKDALLAASETKGRRRDRLNRDLSRRVQRVAELIEDYSPLRRLSAFQRLEADLAAVLDRVS